MEMMRPRPDVGEDQRPEVHYGQAVGVHRALRLLGNEVVHDAEKAGGEEEADGVVPVPPLHHGILHPGVGRVGFEKAHRQRGAVEDVEHGNGDDECAVEPVCDIDMGHFAFDDGAEEDDRVGHPDHGDQHVDRPLELGVLLGGRDAERQRDRGQHDDQLPAPERECGELVEEQPYVAGALYDVVRRREQGRAAKREDHGVGVQRPQAPESEPRDIEVESGPDELCGNEDAHQHPDDAPHHGHDGELADDGVVVGLWVSHISLSLDNEIRGVTP